MRGVDVYAVLFDIEAGYTARFLAWYTRRHAVDLLEAGFLSVQAFESVRGSPRFMTLWDQDHDVLQAPEYALARARDPELAESESRVCNLQKGTYRQIALVADTDSRDVGAEWLGVLRFDLPEESDQALSAWLRGAISDLGAARPRLGVRLGGHPLFPESVAPRLLLIVESPAELLGLDDIEARLRKRFAGSIGPSALTVARRYFAGGRASGAG
jgi:hypothetical protein